MAMQWYHRWGVPSLQSQRVAGNLFFALTIQEDRVKHRNMGLKMVESRLVDRLIPNTARMGKTDMRQAQRRAACIGILSVRVHAPANVTGKFARMVMSFGRFVYPVVLPAPLLTAVKKSSPPLEHVA